MGYRQSKEACDQINNFVNDPGNTELPFQEMVTSIKAIIKSAENKAGQAKITSSSWDERDDIHLLKGHSQCTDQTNSPLVNLAIHWASSDKGGCLIAHNDSPAPTNDQFIPFYSFHFREGFNESININGHITYFRTESPSVPQVKPPVVICQQSECHHSSSKYRCGKRHH